MKSQSRLILRREAHTGTTLNPTKYRYTIRPFIMEAIVAGAWMLIKRFKTKDELMDAIDGKRNHRGRVAGPKLKWEFIYSKGMAA